MGNSHTINKINYEDMQHIIKLPDAYLLINTMPESEQKCIIPTTISVENEIQIINNILKTNKKKNIVIYGKNCNDESVSLKYNQLLSLGFTNIYVYLGGLFEWLMLQDIYGKELFPTTYIELDLLKYKSKKILAVGLLTY